MHTIRTLVLGALLSAFLPGTLGGAEEKPLPAFGYDIFQEGAEPVLDGPVDEQYVLSPGDEVIVSIWGQVNQQYPLTVGEDGYIEIPDGGGRVYTNGVSLKELKGLVLRRLSETYATYIDAESPGKSTAFVDVKLGKLRKILIFVVGEVRTQGSRSMSPGVATVLNLLNNAGGVKETGSLRQIRLRRANGAVETVDLYDFLLTGKLDTRGIQARSGDYVIVPLKAKSVSVRGEVRRPGIYETVGNEGLKDLVRFAGGLRSNAYLTRVQVRRFEPDTGEKVLDLNLREIYEGKRADFALADGDTVTVFANVTVRRPVVEVEGAGIRRPGVYQFEPGMRLDDLLSKAEGLKDDVYLDRADLVRTNEDFSKTLTKISLRELYREESPGRYRFAADPGRNFQLKEMDVVKTYSAFEMRGRDRRVTLEGRVKEPGTYVVADNATLYDLLFARGGFQDQEFRRRTYLELAHLYRKRQGETSEELIPFHLGRLIEGDAKENRPLEAGDRIVVYAFEEIEEQRGTVFVEGLVKRQGIYLFAEGMTLRDVVLAAGGLRQDAYRVEAVIARSARTDEAAAGSGAAGLADAQKTIVVPFSTLGSAEGSAEKTRLEAFDKVTIRHAADWEPLPVVLVGGEVLYPGPYTLTKRDERLSSIVARAGGLRPDALVEGASLARLRRFVDPAPSLKGQEGYDTVAIRLEKALANPGGDDDLVLKHADRVFVPPNPGVVEVRGAVRRPAFIQHIDGAGIGDYVARCGGFLETADRKAVFVRNPNGSAAATKTIAFLRFSPPVLPGSVIEVPLKAGKEPAEAAGAAPAETTEGAPAPAPETTDLEPAAEEMPDAEVSGKGVPATAPAGTLPAPAPTPSPEAKETPARKLPAKGASAPKPAPSPAPTPVPAEGRG